MRLGRRLAQLAEPRALASAVRLGLLGFCFVVAAIDPHPRRTVAGALVLAGAALISYIPARNLVLRRLLPTLEACIAAGAVIAPPADRNGLLPYLLAPAFAAGLLYGLVPAVTASGMAAFVLLTGHLIAKNPGPLDTFASTASQWVLLALAVGLLAAWIRRLAAASGSSDQNRSYEAAYELLSQLRTVSRQLVGGLDPISLAQGLLQTLHTELPFDRAAVFVRTEGGRLVPLALEGASVLDWDTSLAEDTPLGRAWLAPGPTSVAEPLGERRSAPSESFGAHTVLPLRMGSRTFGLVALETRQRPPLGRAGSVAADPRQVAPAMRIVDETALRLETALLFGEVRSIATSEERRRLAREIHDGIAQELASLGYAADDLVAEAAGAKSNSGNGGNGANPALVGALRNLRSEITRIVGELRLSIFDLRSEVQAQIGLGTALSDYVRAVGVGTTFSVHLVLDEAPERLPIASEAELLRIAQEAITNARKHAAAEHLWVTLRVDPPSAHLRIEDDGRGMGTKRHDSFGLEVMRERAARLGGELTIGSREPHGTFVDVRLGELPGYETETENFDPQVDASIRPDSRSAR
ncbi:MAG TPA: ATP-binding protein [Acidothermaceae bacterium]|jgi:signal transduction histidine kinase|nr:ATP-binding protein [Acidothermaceae bacterium]